MLIELVVGQKPNRCNFDSTGASSISDSWRTRAIILYDGRNDRSRETIHRNYTDFDFPRSFIRVSDFFNLASRHRDSTAEQLFHLTLFLSTD